MQREREKEKERTRVAEPASASAASHPMEVVNLEEQRATQGLVQGLLDTNSDSEGEAPKTECVGLSSRQLKTQLSGNGQRRDSKVAGRSAGRAQSGRPKAKAKSSATATAPVSMRSEEQEITPEDSVSQAGVSTVSSKRRRLLGPSLGGGKSSIGRKSLPELVTQVQKWKDALLVTDVLDGLGQANEQYQLRRAIAGLKAVDEHHIEVHQGQARLDSAAQAQLLVDSIQDMTTEERRATVMELASAQDIDWPGSMQEKLLTAEIKTLLELSLSLSLSSLPLPPSSLSLSLSICVICFFFLSLSLSRVSLSLHFSISRPSLDSLSLYISLHLSLSLCLFLSL